MASTKDAEKKRCRFTDFELDERLYQAINEIGWEYPTTVQAAMIPQLLQGSSVCARARTGTGKTAAFLLPLIQKVIQCTSVSQEQQLEGPFAMVLAPTKELTTQIFDVFTKLIARFPYIHALNMCDNEQASEEFALNTAMDVIMATPSRLFEMAKKETKFLKNIKFVVLDEADLLISFGYREDLLKLKKYLPVSFQSAMTSATLEEDISEVKTLFASGTVVTLKLRESQLPSTEQLSQYQMLVNNDEERFTIIVSLLKLKLLLGKTIFFVNSVDRCYKLHLFLQSFKLRSCVLNSQMPANSRSHIINSFNAGKYQYIIASDSKDVMGTTNADQEKQSETDVSKKKAKFKKEKRRRIKHDQESGVSRGIDFHFVSNVVNFDFPDNVDLYIHRVGRTARGYNKGTAISLIGPNERINFEVLQDYLNKRMGYNIIAPYEVRMTDFDSFLLRTREVLSAITKTVIREARLAEIKRELLESKRLQAYFANNPRERQALQNDKKLYQLQLHSTGISDVADYMVPKPLRNRNYKSNEELARLGDDGKRRSRKRTGNSLFGKKSKFSKNSKDPLRTFSF